MALDDFVIASFPVNHRVQAYGYAFIEHDRPGRFDVEAARTLGVTEGPDFGRLQRGETVNGIAPEQVVGEDRPGRRIVYTGDTAPVPVGRGLRPPGRPARARGDLPSRRTAPVRARPATRPPPQAARTRSATRGSSCSP